MQASSRKIFLTFTLCFILGPRCVSAQTGTGRMSGIVKDSTGAVIPAVTVSVVHEPTGIKHQTTTTESGAYAFPSLPVGPYSIIVELQGFKKYTAIGNTLTVGIDLEVDVTLQPGALNESVNVTTSRSMEARGR